MVFRAAGEAINSGLVAKDAAARFAFPGCDTDDV